jgi:hypothetical protein
LLALPFLGLGVLGGAGQGRVKRVRGGQIGELRIEGAKAGIVEAGEDRIGEGV